MDEFNSIVEIINNALPMVQSGIPAITGGFITAMFLRGNTRRKEFEKIKLGKINEAINDLVDSRELTLTELMKCRNLLKIAEMADEEYAKDNRKNKTERSTFDFDWFLRFFESAGNISNKDMQQLWAKVLNEEYKKPNSHSYRTLEKLYHLSKNEASLFKNCADFRIETPYNEVFVLSSEETFSKNDSNINLDEFIVDEASDWIQIITVAYQLSHEKLTLLAECGILSSILVTSHLSIEKGESTKLFNSTAIIDISLSEHCKYEELTFDINGFRFTDSAIQLFPIIESKPKIEFVLDVARLIEHYNPDFIVRVYEVIDIDEDGCYVYNDDYDILHLKKYSECTELPDLNKLDQEIKNGGACTWK
jgi:hypothetical protein